MKIITEKNRIYKSYYLVATAITPLEIFDSVFLGDYESRKAYMADKRYLMEEYTMANTTLPMGLVWRPYANLTKNLKDEVNSR